MQNKLPGACLLLLTLAACAPAAKQAYRAPLAGPTAQVSFHNATQGRTEVALFGNATECTDRQHLPGLLIDDRQTVQIPGGQAFAFSVHHLVPNTTPPRYCDVTASFNAETNGRYDITISSAGEQSCKVHVRQLGSQQGDQALKVVSRAPVKSRSEDGPFCQPLR
jgi:hypothetical protein